MGTDLGSAACKAWRPWQWATDRLIGVCIRHVQEKNGEVVDPGAAVALGAPMLVRLLVPCWVVNATPLPISVAVLRIQRPAPPPAPDASVHGRQPGSLMKAADAMHNIKVYETGYTFK